MDYNEKPVNGNKKYWSLSELMESSDWNRSVWLEYLYKYGDKKPTDAINDDHFTTPGVLKPSPCPVCGGARVFVNVNDNSISICETCNGFGYFDHAPEPITEIVGWK